MTNLERKINKTINMFSHRNFSQWSEGDIDSNKYSAFKVKEDGTIDKSCMIEDKGGYATEIEALNAIGDKQNCKAIAGSILITQYPHLFK